MTFGKTSLELKVGAFVFLGLAILAAFVLSIGGFKTWASGYQVNFIYNFVNGIKIGAPVRFAGVDVGEVKRINFIYPDGKDMAKIQVVSWIKKNVRIPRDSTVWVNTLGLLGEKYIEIMPGNDYMHCLAARQSFDGIDPIAMHEVFRLGKGIITTLDDSIRNKQGTIGRLLYDDTVYKELEALVIDIRKHPWKLFWKTKEKPVKK
ncbi:MAG TPA: MlaD family protein [Candidatus Omnitrophota bacterium]|nr:MlaD family protein [Candidatus Omnitrophota bacterium]